MELTKYKRLKNRLPRFDNGTSGSAAYWLLVGGIAGNNKNYLNKLWEDKSVYKDDPYSQNPKLVASELKTPTVSETAANGDKSTGFGYSDMFQHMAASMVRGHADAAATHEDLEKEYQHGYGNIGGIGYETVSFDAGQKEKDAYKKWLGEMATDPLAALTRRADWLFTNVKEKWRKEQRLAARTTDFNQNAALSQVIRNNQSLLNASDGKNLPHFQDGLELVATPYGMTFGKRNSMVSSGEELVSGDGRSSFTVPGGKNNKDNIPAMLAEGTDGTAKTGDSVVLSNKNNAADYYRATGDLYGAQMMNPAAKTNKWMFKAKNGKNCLPKYSNGDNARFSAWTSIVPNAIGMSTSLGLYVNNMFSHSPSYDIPHLNPYESLMLDNLSRLRIPTLPTTNALRSAEGRAKSAIAQSGGLGAGLKMLSYLSAYNNTQRNIADALMNIKMQNNSYFSDYSKTALQAGAANAQRAMQAAMYKNEMRDKQIAARRNVLGQDIANWMGYLQNGYKQYSTSKLHNYIMDTYDERMDLDKLRLMADIKNMNTYADIAKSKYGFSPNFMKNMWLISQGFAPKFK